VAQQSGGILLPNPGSHGCPMTLLSYLAAARNSASLVTKGKPATAQAGRFPAAVIIREMAGD
jgi:hypothetical protein